jgi:hypothetical protein
MPAPPSPESKRPAARGSDRANSQSKFFSSQSSTTAPALDQDRLVGVVAENSRERSELHLCDFGVGCCQLVLPIATAAVVAEIAFHTEARP